MRHRQAVGESFGVLSLSDGISARGFPFVNVALIVANCAIWVFYELPNLRSAGFQLFEANFGIFEPRANGGGVAFFAHLGGFIVGVLTATVLAGAARVGVGGEDAAALRAAA
jgi:membrane associated rhomboid family serine protease